MPTKPISSFEVESLKVRVYDDARSLGEAAAAHAADRLRSLADSEREFAVIFATGASQFETLRALTATQGIPWERITGFHMDEYVGIPDHHPASFRAYLRERLFALVPFRAFHGIAGDDPDTAGVCERYAELLRTHAPQLCLLGIGENGHLAFNDPAEADFTDPLDVKIVTLDRACRRQQVNEGWFATLADVPAHAITLTMPTLTRVPELILSVPGPRKAAIVKRTLNDPISTACPATILRTHPNATLYLDRASAAEIALP